MIGIGLMPRETLEKSRLETKEGGYEESLALSNIDTISSNYC